MSSNKQQFSVDTRDIQIDLDYNDQKIDGYGDQNYKINPKNNYGYGNKDHEQEDEEDNENFNQSLRSETSQGFSASQILRPSGKQIQKGLKYLDLSITIEKLMYDMQSVLYWSSISEIVCFVFSFFLFLGLGKEMSIIFVFLPHLFRGIIGNLLNQKVPQSHHIIQDLKLESQEEEQSGKISILSFDNIQAAIKSSTQQQFVSAFYEIRKWIIAYVFFSGVCYICDFAIFVIIMVRYGEQGMEDSEIFLIVLILIFIGCSFSWIGLVLQVKHSLPEYISIYFFQALLGVSKNISQKAGELSSNAAKVALEKAKNFKLKKLQSNEPSDNTQIEQQNFQ